MGVGWRNKDGGMKNLKGRIVFQDVGLKPNLRAFTRKIIYEISYKNKNI